MSNGTIKRPLSVWVLTILNGVFAAFLIGTSIKAEAFGFSAGQAAFVGVFGLAITIAAHATWYGYRTGRLVLLILITIFLGLLIAQSIMYIDWADSHRYPWGVKLAIFRAVGSVLWLAVNWKLFFNKRARAFYG